MQREEIVTAQKILQDWYGINYEPTTNAMQRQQIRLLEAARAGAELCRTTKPGYRLTFQRWQAST